VGKIQDLQLDKCGNQSPSSILCKKQVKNRNIDKRKGTPRLVVDGVSQNCNIVEEPTSLIAKQEDKEIKVVKKRRQSGSVELFNCESEEVSQQKKLSERNLTVDSTKGCAVSNKFMPATNKKLRDKLNVTSDQSAAALPPNKKRKLAVLTNQQLCKKIKPDIQMSSASNRISTHKRLIDVGRLKNILKNSKTTELPSSDHQLLNRVNESEQLSGNKLQRVTARSLSDRMLGRLTEARFRYINEQMYNSTGSEAAELFKEDEEAFVVYHSGFQSQVDKWPVNPVDKIIEYIRNW
jgi:hypothetical protein